MIQFIDPRGIAATNLEEYTLALDISVDEGRGITVGLLANGFPDSELFMRKIGDALQRRLPKLRTLLWNKGNAGIEASDDMVREIVSDCQVVIAAYGH